MLTEQTTQPTVADNDLDFDASDFQEELGAGESDQESLFDDVQTETQPSVSEKLKIKYNGVEEEYDLSTQRDDIIALIQKGKNYDHIKSERDTLVNGEEMAYLKQLAKDKGFDDVKQFIKTESENYTQNKIAQRVNQLVSEGMSRKHAEYTAKLEFEKASPQESKETKQEAEQVTEDSGVKGFVELFQEFPELTQKSFEDYPEDFKKDIANGKTPLVAWQKHLLNVERAERERIQKLKDNKAKDLGTMQSGTDDSDDAFLKEFFK